MIDNILFLFLLSFIIPTIVLSINHIPNILSKEWLEKARNWEGSLDETIFVNSYLLHNFSNVGVDYVHDILRVIHKSQFPGKADCANRRLLVMDLSDGSFEGTGAVLREITFALAVAMHSNRTLIWGLDAPLLFRYTKELILEDQYFDGELEIEFPGGHQPPVTLDCRTDDVNSYLSAPFHCFFQPLSECSLEDLTNDEWMDYHSTGNRFSHEARVNQFDLHKAVALYHPPYGLFNYIDNMRKASNRPYYSTAGRAGHLWAGCVAAYIFRLKPSVVDIFVNRMKMSYPYISERIGSPPTLLRDRTKQCFQAKSCTLTESTNHSFVWGMHARHGDLRAYPQTYDHYKKVFSLQKYCDYAAEVSKSQSMSPSFLYLATDSLDAEAFGEEYRRQLEQGKAILNKNKFDQYMKLPKSSIINRRQEMEAPAFKTAWHLENPPQLLVLSDKYRFRTPHGSHAVAAEGGCVVDAQLKANERRCSVGFEDAKLYENLTDVRDWPRAEKVMMVLFEALEDLFVLSLSDKFIGSGSSYYGSVAALLVWARHGADNIEARVSFIDGRDIALGGVYTAFMPLAHADTLNSAPKSSKPKSKRSRKSAAVKSSVVDWEKETDEFVSGLVALKHEVDKEFDWTTPKNRLSLVNMLPGMSYAVFYAESLSWIGTNPDFYWLPGQCPGPFVSGSKIDLPARLIKYVQHVVNRGVDHFSASHVEQSLRCWLYAYRALNQHMDLLPLYPDLASAFEIATGNIGTFRKGAYSPALQQDMDLITFIRRLHHSDALALKTGMPIDRQKRYRRERNRIKLHELAGATVGIGQGGTVDNLMYSARNQISTDSYYDANYSKRLKDNRDFLLQRQRQKGHPESKPFDYFFRRIEQFKDSQSQMKTLPDVIEEMAELELYIAKLQRQELAVKNL